MNYLLNLSKDLVGLILSFINKKKLKVYKQLRLVCKRFYTLMKKYVYTLEFYENYKMTDLDAVFIKNNKLNNLGNINMIYANNIIPFTYTKDLKKLILVHHASHDVDDNLHDIHHAKHDIHHAKHDIHRAKHDVNDVHDELGNIDYLIFKSYYPIVHNISANKIKEIKIQCVANSKIIINCIGVKKMTICGKADITIPNSIKNLTLYSNYIVSSSITKLDNLKLIYSSFVAMKPMIIDKLIIKYDGFIIGNITINTLIIKKYVGSIFKGYMNCDNNKVNNLVIIDTMCRKDMIDKFQFKYNNLITKY